MVEEGTHLVALEEDTHLAVLEEDNILVEVEEGRSQVVEVDMIQEEDMCLVVDL